ncbi:ABC transporter permease [Ruminococcaceae bacterium OttesenSCG-928-D13]|nr:ABC transporter permease [Ruminococcaceae bacterium OttesenSCG-928-D13]
MGINIRKGLRAVAFPLLSILVALLLGAIIMAVMGFNVGKAYGSLLNGAFGSLNSLSETMIQMVPLLFCALSYAIAYRCGLINLGAEGQLYAGAVCGSIVGAHLSGLPAIIHIPLCIIAGFIGGAVMGCIVGFLKMKFGASELITTIMLNYIVMEFVSFCVTNAPFKDMTPGAAPRMPIVQDSAKLPLIMSGTRLHLGILLALVGILVYYFFMWRTTRGYEMRVIGMNPNAGRYSGMNIRSNSILAMLIAGGFAGIGGTVQIIGLQYFLTEGFSNNFGFSGIAVALLGNTHPLGIAVSSVLFGALNAGGVKMQLLAEVPAAAIYMIQGMIILFAVSRELFRWFGSGGKFITQKLFKSGNKEKGGAAG